jgi:hypothetical protein
MIKDILLSFKDTIKTKTTNPFFGTLIIVWILHNWKLIFILFNFNTATTLESKVQFIETYLDPKTFTQNMGCVVVISFIVLICSYFLLNLSRLIVNFYEKKITPFIYKITDENSVVLKDTHDILKKEKEYCEKKLETEKESKSKLQDEYDKYERKMNSLILEKDEEKKNIQKEYINLRNEYSALIDKKEKEIYSIQKEKEKLINGFELQKNELKNQHEKEIESLNLNYRNLIKLKDEEKNRLKILYDKIEEKNNKIILRKETKEKPIFNIHFDKNNNIDDKSIFFIINNLGKETEDTIIRLKFFNLSKSNTEIITKKISLNRIFKSDTNNKYSLQFDNTIDLSDIDSFSIEINAQDTIDEIMYTTLHFYKFECGKDYNINF